jgi:glycerate kinase
MANSPVSSKSSDVIEVLESSGRNRYNAHVRNVLHTQSVTAGLLTREGRKLEISSLTFCVGGPAADGVAEPAAIFGGWTR